MNERIKEISNYVTLFYFNEKNDFCEKREEFLEKFAEVILYQCIKSIYKEIYGSENFLLNGLNDNDWYRSGGRASIVAIKEHFGLNDELELNDEHED